MAGPSAYEQIKECVQQDNLRGGTGHCPHRPHSRCQRVSDPSCTGGSRLGRGPAQGPGSDRARGPDARRPRPN
eukprot:6234803-Pyramimonas_sp.AAC.1